MNLENDKKVIMQKNQGKVWLVGAGPSDPGLMTIKGMDALKNAEVVVYDKLVGKEILNFMPKNAKKIDVGKLPNHHKIPQDQINEILLAEALEGKRVVRLKGGDPFLFGRGGEELELLHQHQIPFEIIPGITSAISVPAYGGIPVTHRDFCSSLHIITGHTRTGELPDIDFEAVVKMRGTLVFLMGVAALETICGGLIQAGMSPDMPAAMIERGTSARQRKLVSTVGNLVADAESSSIKNPAVIVVGKVCTLSEEFEWAGKRPLHGKRVIVTRPEKLGFVLSEKIRRLGGEAVEFPCIITRPIPGNQGFDDALNHMEEFDWLVFTSAAGVEILFEKLSQREKDVRALYGKKLAVIGSGTAKAFADRGIRVDFIPENYNVKSFAEGLKNIIKQGEKTLILRAQDGSKELNEILAAAAISFVDVPVYETVYDTTECVFSEEIIQSYDFDYAAFTSASTVRGFVHAMPDLDYTKITAACIGEETAKAANAYGMNCIVAQTSTLDGLVDVMAAESR